MSRTKVRVAALLLTLGCAACGGQSGGPTHRAQAAPSPRPSSPAKLSIVSPRNGQVIKGSKVPVRLTLKNAHVVKPTSSNIDPRKGHIHVLLDGSIVSMNYGLKNAIPKVAPGTHTLRVEFVASDHLPFDPRVFQEVAFEVRG
jgi:hypothetical protein